LPNDLSRAFAFAFSFDIDPILSTADLYITRTDTSPQDINMIFSKISLILAALASPALAGECKTMNVYRDRRDMDDDLFKAWDTVCSDNAEKPGTTFGMSIPLYSSKDRNGKIGTFEETWITTGIGSTIGSIGYNIEGKGQIITHWSDDCGSEGEWEIPIVGGTGKYRGIQGYIMFTQAGDYSKDKGFTNKMKIYYGDC
jgi:hypothetical protein